MTAQLSNLDGNYPKTLRKSQKVQKRQKQAKLIRKFRKIHRTTGAFLFLLFFVVSITGLTLGWKKNTGGIILPESEIGVSTDLGDWLEFDALRNIAFRTLKDTVGENIDLDLQRIDARPEKGMVKFVFDNHYWGVQLDGATGEVLAVNRRRSDLVENIHDGSILDIVFGMEGEVLKLIYTSIMGTALFTFTVTGFWLWYGPKRMKRSNKRMRRSNRKDRKPWAIGR